MTSQIIPVSAFSTGLFIDDRLVGVEKTLLNFEGVDIPIPESLTPMSLATMAGNTFQWLMCSN